MIFPLRSPFKNKKIYMKTVIFDSCFGVCSGLQTYLNQQGFNIVGYGCTTCIGNSGDLDESVASVISENGIFFIKCKICFFIT